MNEIAAEIHRTEVHQSAEATEIQYIFDRQKRDYFHTPNRSYQDRVKDLLTLKRMLVENRDELTEAICKDYGCRSWHETTFGEFIAVLGSIDYIKKNLKSWMKPQKRHVDFMLFPGAKNKVTPQPLGVVGIIVPWNFPVNLSMIPIASALAAGNRVMVKMSENSGHLARLLTEICPLYFPIEQLTFVEELGGTGMEFSKIPFDLLMFTGSVETGKAVMASAAKNLTPVILELGGKSPAIIDRSYSLEKAVNRIIYAKQFNAGQVCLNVDYVFVDESRLEQFIELAKAAAKKYVPDINNKDYSSIIDRRSIKRLEETLIEAQKADVTVINLSEQPIDHDTKKFPLFIAINPPEELLISQRETFGPILIVRTYQDDSEVCSYINQRQRPLGLYVFSEDKELQQNYINRVMSGGVSINDTMLHAFQDDMPFGGVGHSGIGHYHGPEGFVAFSKMRPIFYQSKYSAMEFLSPPYPAWLTKVYNWIVKLKS